MHIGLLDYRHQCLLRSSSRLQEGWKVRALPELRDRQLDRAGSRLPGPLAIAIALVHSGSGALPVGRARQSLYFQLHHAVGDEADHLPEEIFIRALLNECLQRHSVDRHGSLSWLRLVVRNPSQPRFGPWRLSPPAPLWTSWGKGSTGRRSPVGLQPPSARRPTLVCYTTPRDANPFVGMIATSFLKHRQQVLKLDARDR